jgi:hypothetical protein
MDNLSKAIEQPFVTDVIVPGISRIRDELRISEQEDLIAEQAAAKRAAAAQAMQRAAAAEQQGLDAEIAAAVGGVDVPMVLGGTEGRPPSDRMATGITSLTEPASFDKSAGLAGQVLGREAFPGDTAGSSLRAARMFERAGADLMAGRIRPDSTMQDDLSRYQKIGASLSQRGLGDIVAEIVQGATAEEAFMAAGRQLQQTQQRRGEQEATVEATQRFERALAGDLPQMAAAEQAVAEQALTPMMVNGRPGVRTRGYEGDEEQGRIDAIATRAYRRALDDGKSREESVAIGLAAAQAAQPEAVAAQEAQEAQAIQRPGLIEEANRLREQATAMEREAKGIEATPVYRTFGDHAMAFLDALDSGDVAKQNALMASVGGSTDYQPYGKGAVGKAMGKDASMRARKDLLDLKKKYLEAQRREKTGLKFIEKRAEPKGKKKRTGGGGGGYGKKDQALMDALVTLNRGDSLTDGQKRRLKATGGLDPAEIASLTSDRPAAWRALVTKMRGKRARADARSIMTGQATPEERGVRQLAADEKAAAQDIKRLEAEVKLATGEEKKRKAQELARRKLAAKISSATTRLEAADEGLIRTESAHAAAVREQAQLVDVIAAEKDPVRKATLKAQKDNAAANEKNLERIKTGRQKKSKRLARELAALTAQQRAQTAQAD